MFSRLRRRFPARNDVIDHTTLRARLKKARRNGFRVAASRRSSRATGFTAERLEILRGEDGGHSRNLFRNHMRKVRSQIEVEQGQGRAYMPETPNKKYCTPSPPPPRPRVAGLTRGRSGRGWGWNSADWKVIFVLRLMKLLWAGNRLNFRWSREEW